MFGQYCIYMEGGFSVGNTVELIEQKFDSYALLSLMEYIRIPNLSRDFDPHWDTNGLLEKAAEHIRDWVVGLGLNGCTSEVIKDNGYSPIIYTQVKGELLFTILYYGHFDKQPAFTGWNEGMGPTNPVIKDEKLYGRGGADDGYSTYSTMLSIWALQQQGVKLPRCIMITEGDEETGNHIDHYLGTLKSKIGTPEIIFCLDSGTIDYESMSLTTSLRGVIGLQVKVKMLNEGIHSGDASGVVPSTFRIMRSLISRIQNQQDGQIIKDLQVDIPSNRLQELQDLSQRKGKEFMSHFHLVKGAKHVSQDILTNMIARNWKAQLEVIGAAGFPPAESAGNVLRPDTILKLSIRTPPTLNCQQAVKKLKSILTEDPPYGAQVEITDIDPYDGWNAPELQPYLKKAIQYASNQIFKGDSVSFGQGGSIPFMGLLHSQFPNSQFLITGVLGPQANAHGPNQFLHLSYCKKLTCAMSLILQDVSRHFSLQGTGV